MNNQTAEEVTIKRINELQDVINSVWIIIMSIMIFLFQVGYMMIETGTIKTKNSTNYLLKNLLVMAVSSLTFFCFGYGFANNA